MESKKTEGSEVEYVSALKPWVFIAAILVPPVFFFLNMPLHSMVQWWVWPAWFPPHFFIIIAIFWLWSRATGRSVRAQSLVVLFAICYLVSGWSYMMYGIHYWTMFPMFTGPGFWLTGIRDETYRTLCWDAFPWFTAPHDLEAIRIYWEGGAFDFGPWMPSMAFWSLWLIVVLCGGYLFVAPLHKPLVKVERHVFPYAAAMAHTIEWSTKIQNGKFTLLNLQLSLSKFFWAGAIVGMLTYLPSMISALTPIAFPIYLISPPVNTWIQNILGPILPGARFSGWFAPAEIVMAAFASMDTLITAFLYWLITAVIYPVVGIKLGILPYEPGQSAARYFQEEGPFKADWFAYWGVIVGVGLWMMYGYRDHILGIFKVAFNPSKYPDLPREEEGLSYRTLAFGIIIFFVLFVLLWIAVGANPLMSIIGPLYFIIFMYGWTRLQAEGMHTAATYYHILPFYDAGMFLGQWGPRPDPAALNTMTAFLATGMPGFSRQSAVGPMNQFLIYKIADQNKTRMKDILVVSILTTISAAITVSFLTPWWYATYGGRATLGAVEYWNWNWPWIWNLTGGTPPWRVTPAETAGYTIVGVIFTFICYKLRAMYPWFIINPIGICLPAVWGMAHGMFWTWALIIKAIVLKVGGVRVYEQYYRPAAVGFVMGTGVLYFVTSIIALFTRAIPAFMAAA